MPTYVYRREDGTTFEVFQRITDDALTTDPETGQAVERVIGGGAGLIFRGTGFYETDYVRSGDGKAAKADGAKSEAKTEAASGADTSGGEAKASGAES